MPFTTLRFATIGYALFWFSTTTLCYAYENPFLSQGANEPDGRMGAFSQNDTGDCFFLASLIAIAQDSDGKELIESAFHKSAKRNAWQITFPNLPGQPVEVTEREANEYKLTNSAGHDFSLPAWGDPDIKMLEIAADKIWKNNIKPEGLWDDVPLNVIFMFSNTEQLLIWNRSKATNTHIQDIDKYQRIPEGVVKEIEISSTAEAEKLLKNIMAADTDGISMILIDYANYHALAITHIDFINKTYSYIDTSSNTRTIKGLDKFLHGMVNGLYAVNYLEFGQSDTQH